MPDESEAGDRFGAAEGRAQNALAIGVPGEDIGDVVDAGAVVDLAAPGGVSVTTTHWFQGGDGLAGVAETGDRFGSALTALSYGVLAVGAAGEDAGGLADVGVVQVIGLVMGHTTLSGMPTNSSARTPAMFRGPPRPATRWATCSAPWGRRW